MRPIAALFDEKDQKNGPEGIFRGRFILGPAGSQPGFFTTIAARERKGLKIQSAPSIDDAGTPGGMLRDVSEYTLAIQPAMLPQQIVVRNPG